MIIPTKYKKKKSNIRLTIDPTDGHSVLLTKSKDQLPPAPKGVSIEETIKALKAINKANAEEVKRTREKLRNEIHI